MSKQLMAVLFGAACLAAHGAVETFTLVDFEGGNDAFHNATSNAKLEVVTPAEAPPSGKACGKIILGGLNNKRGGAFNVLVPQELKAKKIAKFSIWIKGKESNAFGPVILLTGDFDGYYCYNGPRNLAKAQIDVTDDSWARYEFKLSDFKKHGDVSGQERPDFSKARIVSLALGTARDYPDAVEFYVDKIELLVTNTEEK